MTDAPLPSPASPSSPAELYRSAIDSAIAAIEPYAVMGESREYERTKLDLITAPFRHPIMTLLGEEDTTENEDAPPVDEAKAFAGLAAALGAFQQAFHAISFPHEVEGEAVRVGNSTDNFIAVAQRHTSPVDPFDVTKDKHAARDFLHAMEAWEDATADLASKLGL